MGQLKYTRKFRVFEPINKLQFEEEAHSVGFMVLCAVISLIVQLIVLFEVPPRYSKLRFFSFVLLEALPLYGTMYYAIKKPSVPYLGWEFGAEMCLWMAGAVLAGYTLAWIVYIAKKK